MAQIKLTNADAVALVDDSDLEFLSTWKWRLSPVGAVYRASNHAPRSLLMHRVLLGVVNAGRTVFVDHADGNRLNNQRSNLRICTNSLNQGNRRVIQGRCSQLKGVTWHRKCQKWQAQIKVHGRSRYLGLFNSEEDAARAYLTAARDCFGQFAYSNIEGAA